MARTIVDGSDLSGQTSNAPAHDAANTTRIDASGGASVLELPNGSFISSASFEQDGHDLVLTAPDGSVVVVEGYFLQDPRPDLQSPEGARLSPQLVDSFTITLDERQFAAAETANDESAIGIISELSGSATVTRVNGTVETLSKGTAIFQGDIIETEDDGAVNITFVDESNFSISEDARLAIDEFVYDPTTQSGTTNVSVLRGVFMFTSGLIGRDNPDSVEIETPVGSIGIRGTIIGGKIAPDGGDTQITVVEGAIVVSNGAGQQILSSQFETVKLSGFNSPIQNIGQIDSAQMNQSYGSVRSVSGNLFSSIDAAGQGNQGDQGAQNNGQQGQGQSTEGNQQTQQGGEGQPAGDANAQPTQSEGQADGEGEGQGEGEAPAADGAAAGEGQQGQGQGQPSQGQPQGQGQGQGQGQPQSTAPTGQPIGSPSGSGDGGSGGSSGDSGARPKANLAPKPSGKSGQSNTQVGDNASGGDGAAGTGSGGSNNTTPNNPPPPPVNKAPEIQVLQTFTLNENDTAIRQIAKLNIFDPNAGDTVNLGLITVNSPKFEVIQDTLGDYYLVKKAGETFNFENASDFPSAADFTRPIAVTVADAKNPALTTTIELPLKLINVNENPTLIIDYRTDADTSFDLSENNVGPRVVARLSASDPDTRAAFINNTFIVNDSRFEVVTVSGEKVLRLKSNVTLDAETEPTITLTIRAVDANDSNVKSHPQTITFNVTDTNDAPTVTVDFIGGNTSYITTETPTVGDNIALLAFADQDTSTQFLQNTYTVDDNRFEIVQVGTDYFLKISSAGASGFDASTESTIDVTITTTDNVNSALTNSVTITVNVADVNQAPTDIILKDPANTTLAFSGFEENQAAGTVVAFLDVIDPDVGDTFTYTLSGADASYFTINTNGELIASNVFDFEHAHGPNYSITVEVDDGTYTFSKNLTITINDVNEAPIDILLNDDSTYYSYETSSSYSAMISALTKGAIIGHLNVTDPDNYAYVPADFTIETAYAAYLEVVTTYDVDGTQVLALKLKNNVELAPSGSSDYEFIINGTPSGTIITLNGNNDNSFDVDITASDVAGDRTETFTFAVKTNEVHLDSLNGNDGYIVINDARNLGSFPSALFASSTAIGDFNGDGVLDVVYGAAAAHNPSSETSGGYYIMNGNAANLHDVNYSGNNDDDRIVKLSDLTSGSPTIPGFFQEFDAAGNQDGFRFAKQVANLGDIDGDGKDDLILSSAGNQSAVIRLGGGTQITLTNIPVTAGVHDDITVAYVGDINGDGFNDILIGTPSAQFYDGNTFNQQGAAFLIYGGNDLPTTINIATYAESFRLNPYYYGDNQFFGKTITGIGDFDGDGFDDFAIGGPGRSTNDGAVAIYSGASGYAAPALLTFIEGTSSVGSKFGESIANIGDINGDGLDDILMSAPNASGANGTGTAYVLYGTDNALSASYNITNLNTGSFNGFQIQYGGDANGGADERLGTTMAGAGDFNGDGVNDFVITGANGEMIDKAFIIFGGDYLETYLTGNANTLMLMDVFGNNDLGLVVHYSDQLDENAAGGSDQRLNVTGGSDLNGDGFDDVIFGSDQYSNTNGGGAAFILYGRDVGQNTTVWSGTSATNVIAMNEIYNGTNENNLLFDNSMSGLTAKGNGGNDTIVLTNNLFKHLDGGAGFDTLKFDLSSEETSSASSDMIDFSTITGEVLNFEKIILYNSQANGGLDAVKMCIADLIDALHNSANKELMFETNHTTAGSNAVAFTNGVSDVYLINSGFTKDANNDTIDDTFVDGGKTYSRFTLVGTEYSVLIDQQLGGATNGGII